MTIKELTVRIEDALLACQQMGAPATSAEIIARFENEPGLTRYNVIAALRAMKFAGALTEIKGRLYLQQGFGG